MPRPFTPLQAHENRLFLEALARSGNSRMAAREVGRAHSSFHERRAGHAEFAQAWEATLVAVQARLHLAGGRRGPEAGPATAPDPVRDGAPPRASSGRNELGEDYRTRGGEPVVVRTRGGKLQLRLAQPGKLTREAEQAFLHALSASANVRLAAAAAGASARAFYRRREGDAAFAREFRLALKMGWERLEGESLRQALAGSHARDRWRQCAPAAMPKLSWDQAFQLLCLHEKSVQQGWDQPHRRRRRGESDETHRIRLAAMWAAEKRFEADEAAVRRAERFEASGSWRHEDEPPPPALPPLEQVTGWSRADPAKAGGGAALALFGGWRIGEMRNASSRSR